MVLVVVVVLDAGLPVAGLALLSVLPSALPALAAGLVSVFDVDVVVLLVCFDVVAVCADAPNAKVAATNKSDRFLIVFICFVFLVNE